MTYGRQFALPFPQGDTYRADTFIQGQSNATALAWLDRPAAWPTLRLAVHGEEGVGKTHLLHVFAQRHEAAFLPADAMRAFMPLPDAPALAIDDADTISDARALLHVLNTAAERQMPVLLSGRCAPAYWAVGLPDLASRLRAVNAVALRAPDDALLAGLLAQVLAERQLCVSERVQAYLLDHLPRTASALHEAAARLDRLSLANGKPVTRALAAMAIGATPVTQDEPMADCDLLSLVHSE